MLKVQGSCDLQVLGLRDSKLKEPEWLCRMSVPCKFSVVSRMYVHYNDEDTYLDSCTLTFNFNLMLASSTQPSTPHPPQPD